jgi:hypothetical protein
VSRGRGDKKRFARNGRPIHGYCLSLQFNIFFVQKNTATCPEATLDTAACVAKSTAFVMNCSRRALSLRNGSMVTDSQDSGPLQYGVRHACMPRRCYVQSPLDRSTAIWSAARLHAAPLLRAIPSRPVHCNMQCGMPACTAVATYDPLSRGDSGVCCESVVQRRRG